ncbi:Ig-like domain-containing protein [Winogradskyella immobilis]|uniref:Ig-like domain-containing protein n=1 Tax=Winogradskyella immobilis TaxID=2816852 RepID=A0ABS8EPQ5_9FLAO|nr:Ig-like domain-containing protein [Winogradskyella immobilis]MCC1484302.1 Ig-like domain-containing protein [Winogradskyella immobilis]MCG0016394.1 Ig-like domain-containing protein [Winogradskyella immobilis]
MSANSFRIYFGIFLVLLTLGCASRGRPTGGPKDDTPPVIIQANPENYTTNFNAEEIRIYFDEYIKIKDLRKQLIISPPMDTEPDIRPLGTASRYISIKIKDTLEANATYALNFGQSIVDNNEENPYPYYRYVFSTGEIIDSLSVKGQILDAENRNADTFVSVMLYEVDSSYTDSLVYKQKPKYITNTLDSITTFSIDNIKAGKYKLVALKDENSNFTYQPKVDKIGFYEGIIEVPKDTLYTIKLFEETPEFKILRPGQVGEKRIIFPYEGDPEGVKIEVSGETPKDYITRLTRDKDKDSLYYWYNAKFEADSTVFIVKNKKYTDTLVHKFRNADKDSLVISVVKSGTLNFGEDFKLEGTTPFSKIDKSKIKIINKDSLDVPFTVKYDSLYNQYAFPIDLQEDESYKMKLLPGALEDMYATQNDTLDFNFRTKKKSDYGNIRVNLVNAKFPLIVQLVDDNGEVEYEEYTTESSTVDFTDLEPKQYFLRAIFDTNKNRKFDSGDYLKQQQPERISYSKPIDIVRANFDNIIEFILLD